jgi:ribokinase
VFIRIKEAARSVILYDEYNQDFMKAAQILFRSDEASPVTPENWVPLVIGAYGTDIKIIALGSQGALLSARSDNFLERIPPGVQT